MSLFSSHRRRAGLQTAAWALSALVAVATLPGCADLHIVQSEVSTYGNWDAGRKPASFGFDRLPSQRVASEAARQASVEQAARPALLAAGFRPAGAGETPDVMVQLGVRIDRQERSPWDDPFWIQAWGPRWAVSPWASPFWHDYPVRRPDYSREVAVLIRDRASGAALYEARARNEGQTDGGPAILGAMFAAALREFPATQAEPHRVVAPLSAPLSAPPAAAR